MLSNKLNCLLLYDQPGLNLQIWTIGFQKSRTQNNARNVFTNQNGIIQLINERKTRIIYIVSCDLHVKWKTERFRQVWMGNRTEHLNWFFYYYYFNWIWLKCYSRSFRQDKNYICVTFFRWFLFTRVDQEFAQWKHKNK